jgi:hypothetical protein
MCLGVVFGVLICTQGRSPPRMLYTEHVPSHTTLDRASDHSLPVRVVCPSDVLGRLPLPRLYLNMIANSGHFRVVFSTTAILLPRATHVVGSIPVSTHRLRPLADAFYEYETELANNANCTTRNLSELSLTAPSGVRRRSWKREVLLPGPPLRATARTANTSELHEP